MWISTRNVLCVAVASALVLCGAGANANEVGSDGAPLNGMAPLYVHVARGDQRAASATLTLPAVRGNKGWYANWIMLVGQSSALSHQVFVQIGLIRRPDQDSKLHVFVAWQGANPRITYRQAGTASDVPHRFAIAQDRSSFALLEDGRTIDEIRIPELAQASRTYVEIGPEVFAEGDALSGSVLFAALNGGNSWKSLQTAHLCRYENHGTVLRYASGRWNASGRFDRRLPSEFHGVCANV